MPLLVIEPEPKAKALCKAQFPEPVSTIEVLLPVNRPLNVNVPPPEASSVAAAPESVKVLEEECPLPVYFNVAPLAIVMAGVEAPVPNELLLFAFATVLTDNVPAFIDTAPVNEFEPVNANVPEPALVKPNDPFIVPEIVNSVTEEFASSFTVIVGVFANVIVGLIIAPVIIAPEPV